jgi:hypothetical protein
LNANFDTGAAAFVSSGHEIDSSELWTLDGGFRKHNSLMAFRSGPEVSAF